MKITCGLFNHMVLQRNRRNLSEADFAGECVGGGVLKALVKRKAGVLKAFRWVRVGQAPSGRMRGRLAGIPAGGPYDIELRVEGGDGCVLDALKIRDVLVGDLWILGGQSNMMGTVALDAAPKPNPFVRAWYMNDVWKVAEKQIHNMDAAVDQIHKELGGWVSPPKEGITPAEPGVFFAKEMHRRTGVPQGLIACAHGGTYMTQWDPRLKKLGGGSLYGAMLRRFRKNGGKVAGVAWYQGESDARTDDALLYFDRMKAFVRAVRRDFGDARLPFVAVQIARVHYGLPGAPTRWNLVQEMQRRLPEAIKNCAVVPAIDLTLADEIHLDGKGQERLGKRIAQAMAFLKYGASAGKAPIALQKITVVKNPASGHVNAIVEFANVIGSLRAGSRPHGFAAFGNPVPSDCLCDVRLEGDKAVLHLAVSESEAKSMVLYYGYGFSPYCNITDSADRSLPVFGPAPLGRPAARTPFVQTLRVSRFLPRAGRLDGLAYPADLASLQFKERTFAGNFCDVHLEMSARAQEDPLAYFTCRLECPEPMKLAALLGYDGPVKLWVDGREKFHDPNGTNPALPDMKRIPFEAAAGTHEVLIALGSNGGRAWGIFLRFDWLDVPVRLLKKGPAAYRMPQICP